MRARALGTGLISGVLGAPGCGDLGDAQLPFAPGTRAPSALPGSMPPRPQAVAVLAIAADSAAARALEQTVSLPPSATREDARAGTGERVVDGDGAGVSCRVQALDGSAQDFELDALLTAEALPRLHVTGTLSSRHASDVRLELTLANGSRLDAVCAVDGRLLVMPGAALLELTDCSASLPEPGRGGYRLDLVAVIERCSH